MKKIRINELARQLEVPSHEILEMLPELGVTEKKTHSSSIDDDVADMIRRHYSGNGAAAIAGAHAEQEAEPEPASSDGYHPASEAAREAAPEAAPAAPIG